jgi:hypothetical protein
MKTTILYYNDTPLSQGEYASQLGKSIIDLFRAGDIDYINIIPFDDANYAQWLGNRSDTQDMRDAWAETKLSSINASFLAKLNKQLKVCKVCNKEFESAGKAKFCSNACRQKDKYKRSKERVVHPKRS